MDPITIEDSAIQKLKELLAQEQENLFLRIFVQGGGCSGFQYGFTFEETQGEEDFSFSKEGVTLLIDGMSMQYLQGSTILHKQTLMGGQFEIKNPNATSKCGCGSSFTV